MLLTALPISDHATIAGLLAIAIGLVKILEKVIEKFFKRNDEESEVVVKLDLESTRTLRDIKDGVEHTADLIRKHDRNEEEIFAKFTDISSNMNEMATAQERTARTLERMDNKLDDLNDNVSKRLAIRR